VKHSADSSDPPSEKLGVRIQNDCENPHNQPLLRRLSCHAASLMSSRLRNPRSIHPGLNRRPAGIVIG
jgi:hypothetical protein